MTAERTISDLQQRALLAYQHNRWAEGAELCNQILRLRSDEPNALLLLGNIRLKAGDPEGAQAALEAARAVAPANIHVLNSLGSTYRLRGRLAEARIAFETALGIESRFAPALNNLGNVFEGLGDDAAARSAYERAVDIDPKYAEALKNLAGVAERQHSLGEARQLAEHALELSPNMTGATLILARVDLRQDNPADALARLERTRGVGASNAAAAAGIRAQAYEKLGQYDRALASFAEANEALKSIHAQRYAAYDGVMSLRAIGKMLDWLRANDSATWPRDRHAEARNPVFLLGFPRSGTTLLDQILASHPSIRTLEERNNFIDAIEPLILREGGLAHLTNLDAQEIAFYQKAYWARVGSALADLAPDHLFVDKLPLNTVLLPLIYRLFPRAKIIFAVRDPRDVVISCFQQRFDMNGAMFQMLSLEGTVRYYDAVMTLGAAAIGALPLDVHLVRYEDVVTKFDETIAGLVSFLGLQWDDKLRAYASTARRRTIDTPSATQVVQPLYTSSIGKWRHYRSAIAPSSQTLGVWLDHFGYSAE